MPKQEQLFNEIDILPIDLKIKIVDRILSSITPTDSLIDEQWIKEIERRKREVENGKATLVDGDEVFRKIFKRLR